MGNQQGAGRGGPAQPTQQGMGTNQGNSGSAGSVGDQRGGGQGGPAQPTRLGESAGQGGPARQTHSAVDVASADMGRQNGAGRQHQEEATTGRGRPLQWMRAATDSQCEEHALEYLKTARGNRWEAAEEGWVWYQIQHIF